MVALAAGLTFLVPPPASAFQLVPLSSEFAPKGAGANQTFRVVNDGEAPVAVQISTVSREMDIDGHETLEDAEDNFVVFPPQLILAAGDSRTIRLQWIGDPEPKMELPYRIIAEQLPVDLGAQQPLRGKLKLLLRYQGSLYIVPLNARSDVKLAAAEAVLDPKGAQVLALTLENSGTKHARLGDPVLTLKSPGGKDVTLSGDRLKNLIGENVLAAHRRRFLLPWPAEIPFGPVGATLDVKAIP